MKVSNWKKYQSICTPKTYYVTVKGSNWNVKVSLADIAGTNQDGVHHSKQVFHIVVSDGYRDLKLNFYQQGLVNCKKIALEMLEEVYKNCA